jgi:hypothetical protein
MDTKVYELTDLALKKMVESPATGYSQEKLTGVLNCTEEEANNVCAILLCYGYADFPKYKPIRELPEKELLIQNKGADFYLSGGFKEQMKREKLMRENIEASIRTANSQRKIGKTTLIVAAVTCVSLIVQIILSICFFYKSVRNEAISLNNVKTVENAFDAFPRKGAIATQFN